jgi:hypothetical protein
MAVSVDELESTTFYGKRFTRKQLALIQETVALLPNLSLRELGHTICEQLNWVNPKGSYKIQSCLQALEQMQARGLLQLPEKRAARSAEGPRMVARTEQAAEGVVREGEVEQVLPLGLELVSSPEQTALWNEYVDRYHYLGYRRPIGSTLRYFIRSEKSGERLGCLGFSASAVRALASRDQWIGWSVKQRRKRLNWVVTNTRFLIFPWLRLRGLASKSLALAAGRIAEDWEAVHGYRPVLLETFVDSSRYAGTCYRAANWRAIGQSSGKDWTDSGHREDLSPKTVYVYPLTENWREVLTQALPAPRRRRSPKHGTAQVVEHRAQALSALWLKIMDVLLRVGADADQLWRQRRRVIHSLLLILFVFRLVFSKNQQGYGTTLQELWEQCRRLGFPLPQPRPVAASAICQARKKLPAAVFKSLNRRILETYPVMETCPWKGHRVFAVDGSKINLPPPLTNWGYPVPSPGAYPQGLVSCLYYLPAHVPCDFSLSPGADERALALRHLAVLQPGDVVAYDRGYHSYQMLYRHLERGLEMVCRLRTNHGLQIDDFFASAELERQITLLPSPAHQREMLLEHPDLVFRPLALRLVKYRAGATTFVLGTTLLDGTKYPIGDLAELYHGRWGIEELYKISKVLIDVEDFHAKTEEGVKQELFAHFTIVTLSRLFSNDLEASLAQNSDPPDDPTAGLPSPMPPSAPAAPTTSEYKINFKNTLVTIARHVEALFVRHAGFVQETVRTILTSLSACKQRVRPNRSYKRQSNKPVKKWRAPKLTPATS